MRFLFLLVVSVVASDNDGLTCNDLRTTLSDKNCCRIETKKDTATEIIYRSCTISTPDPATDINRTGLLAGYDYCEKGQVLVATGLPASGTHPTNSSLDHKFWKCSDLLFVDRVNNPDVDPALLNSFVSGKDNHVGNSDASAVAGQDNSIDMSRSSVCLGQGNVIEEKPGSVALGTNNEIYPSGASKAYQDSPGGSVAIGRGNKALGDGTVAVGTECHAEGHGALAFGIQSRAEGDFTTAFGGTSQHPAMATAIGGMAIGPHAVADKPYCIAIGTTCASGKGDHVITAKNMVLECEVEDGEEAEFFNVGSSAAISAALLRPRCRAIPLDGQGTEGACLFPITYTPRNGGQTLTFSTCLPADDAHRLGSWCPLDPNDNTVFGYCTQECDNPIAPQTTCSRRRRLKTDTHIAETETHVDMVSYPTVHLGGIVHANNVVLETVSSSADRRVKRNIRPADTKKCLDNINKLHVREYEYSDAFRRHADKLHATSVGFIAQEVEKILPEAIMTRSSQTLYGKNTLRGAFEHEALETHENFKMLNKQLIFTHAIGAVQELTRQLRTLQRAVDAMS